MNSNPKKDYRVEKMFALYVRSKGLLQNVKANKKELVGK